MGDNTAPNASQPLAPSGVHDSFINPNLLVPPLSTIFLGPQPHSDLSQATINDLSNTPPLDGSVTPMSGDQATASVRDQQTMLTMHVIPPTLGDNIVGAASSGGTTDAEPSTPTAGQQTAMVNAALIAGYDDLEVVPVRLVDVTNLSTQQILDGWDKSRSCTVNWINHWNQY